MIGTYASAALICAVSLLVGRALLSLAGRERWSWLEPAVGLASVLTVTGLLARAPGHGTSATVGVVVLIVAAIAVVTRTRYDTAGALRAGAPVAIVVALVLAIPFAVSGRWGLLGVGFNNDLGLHLAWAEWLRSGFGPAPDSGYPLGPHGLAVATAAVPGIGLGQAFLGEIIAIGILTGLTALAALGELGAGRRTLAAALVAVPYLAASYFAQAAFKETAEALFVLAFALFLVAPGSPPQGPWPRLRFVLPPLALAGGIFFSYSFAGLAWPVAIGRPLEPDRAGGAGGAAAAGAAAIPAAADDPAGDRGSGRARGAGSGRPLRLRRQLQESRGKQHLRPGLPDRVAGDLAGLQLPLERRRGRQPAGAGGGDRGPGAAGRGRLVGLAAASDDPDRARRLRRAVPDLAPLQRRLLAGQGADDRRPAGDAGRDPAAAERLPRRCGRRLRAALVGWRCCRRLRRRQHLLDLLVLRDAPVGPGGHGAELEAFLPIVHGKPVLYAGQDRYAAYDLLGADTHVPLVEFPDADVSPSPEKPFDTGDAYSPIDFDSFSRGTLDAFPYVITGRAAWNSQAPPNFKRVATTPSYVLWERTGPTPENRHVLLEGTEAGAFAGCDSPEIRILLANRGRASLFPGAVIGAKGDWSEGSVLGTGAETSQRLNLPAGELEPLDPVLLALRPDPQRPWLLRTAAGGARRAAAEHDQPRQQRPVLAGGRFEQQGRRDDVHALRSAGASTLQSLSGYDGQAYLGELVAVPAKPHRIVPLAKACNGWIDWYESERDALSAADRTSDGLRLPSARG